MSYDSNKNGDDIGMDLNTLVIWQTGIVFTVITVVMIIFLYGLYLRVENAENERKIYTPRLAEVSNTRLEQLNQITRYSWIDPDNNLVTIPIDLAMIGTAAELNQLRSDFVRGENEPAPVLDDPDSAEKGAPEDRADSGE